MTCPSNHKYISAIVTHDEWQNDVYKDHTDEFAYEVCPIAFRSSGEHFRYRLPIDCDAKVGLTWAETH